MIRFCDTKFVVLFLSLFFLFAVSLHAQDKGLLPPPESKELKKATASIRKLLADQYRDSSPEGRVALLKLLQKTADESVSDTVNHFALLSEIQYAASVFGAVEEGWSACEEMGSTYEVSELPQLEFIKRAKVQLTEETAASLYAKGVELAELLIDEDRFANASKLARSLNAALKRKVPNVSELEQLVSSTKNLERKFKQIQSDFDVLVGDPSNEQANEKVGQFYCLEKNDFERGLPYLAKGIAGPLRELTQDELSLKKVNPKQRLKIADRWWDLAKDKKLEGFRLVALTHYRQIVSDLNGLDEIRVEQRIQAALTNDRDRSTAVLVGRVWSVDWSDGSKWRALRFLADSAEVRANGKVYSLQLKFSSNGAEMYSVKSGYRYSVLLVGEALKCHKVHSQKKEEMTGIGQIVAP